LVSFCHSPRRKINLRFTHYFDFNVKIAEASLALSIRKDYWSLVPTHSLKLVQKYLSFSIRKDYWSIVLLLVQLTMKLQSSVSEKIIGHFGFILQFTTPQNQFAVHSLF
jgi:hypothetical protein